MAAILGTAVANDLANQLLTFYVKKGPLAQTTQDKPLLRELVANMDDFPGGKDNVSDPVQGTFMEDTAGFYVGYTEDDGLAFTQGQDVLRAAYPWKEMAGNLVITWTELKKDGITMLDNGRQKEHKSAEAVRITTGVLKSRLANFGESMSRARQKMLWRDGTQDAKAVPGVLSILTDDPNTGTTGGLDRATYSWWRHRARVGGLAVTSNTGPKITASAADQTLTETLLTEMIQLRRYGGKPNLILCGSGFWEQLRHEVRAKGQLTLEGFTNRKATDIAMAPISIQGIGTFEYDPTLDDLGRSKFAYFIDTRHLKLRPMDSEWNKMLDPTRPYNALVFLKSITDTAALGADMLNCHGVYEVA